MHYNLLFMQHRYTMAPACRTDCQIAKLRSDKWPWHRVYFNEMSTMNTSRNGVKCSSIKFRSISIIFRVNLKKKILAAKLLISLSFVLWTTKPVLDISCHWFAGIAPLNVKLKLKLSHFWYYAAELDSFTFNTAHFLINSA